MKVLIAEDHILFREALISLLQQIVSDIQVYEVAKYEDMFKLLDKSLDFNLIILDLDLPDENWEVGLQKLNFVSPSIKLIVITANETASAIKKAVHYGAVAYIPKSIAPKIINNALKIVLDGGTYLPLQAIEKFDIQNHIPVNTDSTQHLLTFRQLEVLKLIAEGKSNKQIAYEMNIAEATVKLHINSLLKKLKVTNRTQAVIQAQKLHIL